MCHVSYYLPYKLENLKIIFEIMIVLEHSSIDKLLYSNFIILPKFVFVKICFNLSQIRDKSNAVHSKMFFVACISKNLGLF